VAKKSASVVATAISAVKAAEQKKKRKRRVASPLAIAPPMIPTPRSQEVGSEDEEERRRRRRRRRMMSSKSCRSLKTRQRGGQKVLLPRGSESWCRRRRRKLSNVVFRGGENGEEGKGIRFPYLIWAVMLCRDGSAAAARGWWCRLMAAALGRSRGRGRWLLRCGARGGEPVRPFYRRGKVGLGEDF
jgi:hypothetical protein